MILVLANNHIIQTKMKINKTIITGIMLSAFSFGITSIAGAQTKAKDQATTTTTTTSTEKNDSATVKKSSKKTVKTKQNSDGSKKTTNTTTKSTVETDKK
jgi:hypothetical protein